MKRKWLAIALGLALLLAGCGGGAANGANGNMKGTLASGASSAPDSVDWAENSIWDMSMGGVAQEHTPSEPESSVYQNPDAKLIRRAELEVQTEEFDKSVEALEQMVSSCGGYFENASVYGGSRRDAYASRCGEYVVRIPAENYGQFLTGAGDLGYVTSKNEGSDNVGETYYDLEARLKTQRTKQARLLALLEKAESMEDIIALESALTDVEYQIEQYSSNLNRYDALISFATFNISLWEVGQVTQEVGETSTLGERMSAGFQASFRNLGESCQNCLIWVSYNIFLLVILAGVAAVAAVVGRQQLKKLKRRREERSAK